MNDNKSDRRLHSELHSKAENHLTEAIAEMMKLKAPTSDVVKVIALRSRVSDLVDTEGENGHYWNFDAERGGVHCARCKRAKNLASQDRSQCTGDPAFIAVA